MRRFEDEDDDSFPARGQDVEMQDTKVSSAEEDVFGNGVGPQTIGARFNTLKESSPDRAHSESAFELGGEAEASRSTGDRMPPQLPQLAGAGFRSHKRNATLIKTASNTLRITTKTVGVGMIVIAMLMAVTDWPPTAIDDDRKRESIMSALFLSALFLVATEDIVGINKSAVMLVSAATMWTFLAVHYHPTKSKAGAKELHHELNRGLQDVGSVILFLLPAMALVESIDHFGGFTLVTLVIRKCMAGKTARLMPIVCTFVFFLSSVIDNLTATIVALKILSNIATGSQEQRHLCGGLVVLAANAGGVWSPVGDVTTTMLWIQAKVTTPKLVSKLFLPSLVSGLVPLLCVYRLSRRGEADGVASEGGSRRSTLSMDEDENGELSKKDQRRYEKQPLHFDEGSAEASSDNEITSTKVIILVAGILLILAVPCLKIMTGLPPYLGMLLALGAMWLLTDALVAEPEAPEDAREFVHGSPDSAAGHAELHGVMAALHKVDLSGLLFFTGVLLAVGALDSAGVLHRYANDLVKICHGSPVALCTLLGLSSAVVDNVPLVQASIDMFHETNTDDPLWHLVALAAGTGGSCLSVGSIAGVTLMSMEGVSFLWYMRNIGPWALLGFFAGIATHQIEQFFGI